MTKVLKCTKGEFWAIENDYEKPKNRVCENCVNQFICKQSNWVAK